MQFKGKSFKARKSQSLRFHLNYSCCLQIVFSRISLEHLQEKQEEIFTLWCRIAPIQAMLPKVGILIVLGEVSTTYTSIHVRLLINYRVGASGSNGKYCCQ